MVKNTKGGSNHKKFARKSLSLKGPQKTRLANENEPCEMYAIVTKMFGQGVCEVKCNDGIRRQCIIRKKFSGRNKQSNIINISTKVLVGLRDWEVIRADKMPKCDLLEVYNNNDIKFLKKDPRANWDNLVNDNEEEILGINEKVEFDYDEEKDESDNIEEKEEETELDLDDI